MIFVDKPRPYYPVCYAHHVDKETRMKLTVDLVRDLANGLDIRQLKKLSATHMSITALDDIR